jgi:hypothetical protein
MQKVSQADLKPGDLILSRTDKWLSKAIRFFSSLQSGHARFSHSAMYIGNGLLIEALVRVRINPITKYDDQEVVVWRLKDYDDSERLEVAQYAMLLAGDSYGWLKIPLFALDSVSTFVLKCFKKDKQVYFFTRTFGLKSFRVCSILWAYCWKEIAKHIFNSPEGKEIVPKSQSPDFQDDYMIRNKQTLVFSSVVNDRRETERQKN